MLVLSAAWQLFDATVNTFAESLRAAGDTVFTLWARVTLAWIVFVPGSWISVRKMGAGSLLAVSARRCLDSRSVRNKLRGSVADSR